MTLPAATGGGDATATILRQQLLRLSALQVLQARLRLADPAELPFIAVNETHQMLPYQQAALWMERGVHAVSGAAAVEPGAPYTHWLNQACRHWHAGARPPGPVEPGDLPTNLAQDWAEWLPASALWCPLRDPHGAALGGLLFARPQPWAEGDVVRADAVAGATTQAFLVARLPRRARRRASRRWIRPLLGLITAALLACTLLPVPETVLAPAEVVPDAPALVRAPFSGVLEGVAVQPNTPVKAGQIVATLDRRQIATSYDIARKALEATRTEYQQVAQEAVSDPRARGRVALLQSKIDEQQADADYQRGLLDRTALTAPVDGIAVFNDPVEWIGKPVETGERIMLVAPPLSVLVEAQVPAGSMIALEPGAEALFFDNLKPDRPSRGRVDTVAYASATTVENVLAYAVRVRLADGETARLGLRGTVKLYGPARPFILWALRRPIAAVRQWTAF